MDMKTIEKILLAVGLLVVLGFAGLMLMGGDTDDYDYPGQVQELTGKLGYDTVSVDVTEVEKGTNVLGVPIINVIGTFTDDEGVHDFKLNCDSDHDPDSIAIDGSIVLLDHLGDAVYNYAVSDLESVPDDIFGGTSYPDEGKRFVLVDVAVKNLGHSDGMGIDDPELVCAGGDRFGFDWDSTYSYSDTYPTEMKLGLGNEYRYQLVYEIPADAEPEKVRWDGMTMDFRGYVLDESLEVSA